MLGRHDARGPWDLYLHLLDGNTEDWVHNRLGNETILEVDG